MCEAANDAPDVPRDECPLCGRGNGCGAVQGQDTCWCFNATISVEALARVPPELVGVACLCRDCATGRAPSPCLNVCVLDDRTGRCQGCHRTLEEVTAWPTMDDAARWAVLGRLAEWRRRTRSG